jgi:hypothetical protein
VKVHLCSRGSDGVPSFLDADGSPPLPDRTSRMKVDHLRQSSRGTKNEIMRGELSSISWETAEGCAGSRLGTGSQS